MTKDPNTQDRMKPESRMKNRGPKRSVTMGERSHTTCKSTPFSSGLPVHALGFGFEASGFFRAWVFRHSGFRVQRKLPKAAAPQ